MITDADVPGYRGVPMPPPDSTPSATSTAASMSPECTKLFDALSSLQRPTSGPNAGEVFQSGNAPDNQAMSIFVQLQAFPAAAKADVPVADLRQGVVGCKIAKGDGYGNAVVTALPVDGVGDASAAFAMDVGSDVLGATGYLIARVGSTTLTVEVLGLAGGANSVHVLSDQLKAVAVKQVGKLRAAGDG